MKKMNKMKKKGFTLVEIMIVVAIIGLLAAIGIPSFQKARANSIDKSMDNNVRIVSSAAEQFAMEAGRATGAVTAGEYGDFIKGYSADDTILNVGEVDFNAPDVTLGTTLTRDDCYTP